MSTLQITEQLSLSTDHAASSYAKPVALFHGLAYGPGDEFPNEFYGAHAESLNWLHESCAQAVKAEALKVGLIHHPLVQQFE